MTSWKTKELHDFDEVLEIAHNIGIERASAVIDTLMSLVNRQKFLIARNIGPGRPSSRPRDRGKDIFHETRKKIGEEQIKRMNAANVDIEVGGDQWNKMVTAEAKRWQSGEV